ncbi:hypothetical protein PCASD_09397 [Puccinia coronata f. sp. avenae]|uniref:DNA 3'-5' helicase n=1 Tax=Puccinia coronata f. sp. avenae TaxID=200324 RepID=A0A2N5V1C0_9BASI|nr:hypothetical protein PCASD_09397 [Puccinia coronata f. sp. avenae]
MVPTLIYSGSRNRTLSVLHAIDLAREVPGQSLKPKSSCAKRYHSCTADGDKQDCISDFAAGNFPLISCTMALGLGQNWKRVRMIMNTGRGDPTAIFQMVGRCGQDGRPGLAILLVEKKRRGGKNQISDFVQGCEQSNDDRMDALAITPVCLRIAFSIDNLHGYIHLSFDDPLYIQEASREKELNFPACCCSNCKESAVDCLLSNLQFASNSTFDDIVSDNFVTDLNPSDKRPTKRQNPRRQPVPDHLREMVADFKSNLLSDFNAFHANQVGEGATVQGPDVFGEEDADVIIGHLKHIHSTKDLRKFIGGECIAGQLAWLFDRIVLFKKNLESGSQFNMQKQKRAAPDDANDIAITTTRSKRQKTTLPARLPSTLTKAKENNKTKKQLSAEKQALSAQQKKENHDRLNAIKEKRRIQVAEIIKEVHDNIAKSRTSN